MKAGLSQAKIPSYFCKPFLKPQGKFVSKLRILNGIHILCQRLEHALYTAVEAGRKTTIMLNDFHSIFDISKLQLQDTRNPGTRFLKIVYHCLSSRKS